MPLRFEYFAYVNLVILLALGFQFPFVQEVFDDVSALINSIELTDSELKNFCLYLDVVICETVLFERPKHLAPSQKKRPALFSRPTLQVDS